jgi:hypothetical protein
MSRDSASERMEGGLPVLFSVRFKRKWPQTVTAWKYRRACGDRYPVPEPTILVRVLCYDPGWVNRASVGSVANANVGVWRAVGSG